MKDLDFENLVGSQLLDTGTAEILGQYYIKGKYVDIFGSVGIVLFAIIVLFVLSYRGC